MFKSCSRGRVAEVPNIFRVFFSIPDIAFDTSEISKTGRIGIANTRMSSDKSHLRLLPLYRGALLEVRERSSEGSFTDVVERIPELQSIIKSTVLDDQPLWSKYCEVAYQIWKRRNLGWPQEEAPLAMSLHSRA